MAGGCLILCILTQVLLITTAYGGETDVSVHCPNQYWIEGKPLNLTCKVTCYANDGCNSTTTYQWDNTDNIDFRCKEKTRMITEGKHHTFNCTIENATWKQNTTFKFLVQMTTGFDKTTFNVTKVPSDIPPTHPTNSVKGNSDTQTGESGRSNTVPVAVIGLLCLATVVGVLFYKYNGSILAKMGRCSRKMAPEANII